MPKTLAPARRASSIARTRFTETFFSTFPPPTEKTSTASSAPMREIFSHSANELSHPSSLTRAVSSETLSVGV
jgi:hypothetical protein